MSGRVERIMRELGCVLRGCAKQHDPVWEAEDEGKEPWLRNDHSHVYGSSQRKPGKLTVRHDVRGEGLLSLWHRQPRMYSALRQATARSGRQMRTAG